MALNGGSWTTAALYGALFGFFAYSAYDITNLATLRGWPMTVSLVDLAWGTVATAIASTASFLAVKAMPSSHTLDGVARTPRRSCRPGRF